MWLLGPQPHRPLRSPHDHKFVVNIACLIARWKVLTRAVILLQHGVNPIRPVHIQHAWPHMHTHTQEGNSCVHALQTFMTTVVQLTGTG